MKVNRCCLCVPIGIGVKILGCLDVLNWLMGAMKGDVLLSILQFFPAVTFLWMMVSDQGRTRKYFLLAFIGSRVFILGEYIGRVF